MVETSLRPLTEEERQALRVSLESRGSAGDAVVAGLLTYGVVLGALLIGLPGSWGARWLVPPVVALAAGAMVFFRFWRPKPPRRWAGLVRQDLEVGMAEVTTYRARDAIAVEEVADEGSQYFLELGDRRVLFLMGRYLYEAEEAGVFPNTVFAIARAPESRLLLGLECSGEPLPVLARRRPFSDDDYRSNRVPPDGAILQADFRTLRG